MSKKIRKRLKNVLSAGLMLYKQTIYHELQTHDRHMDKDDYIEFMHMYIDVINDELESAKLALKKEEMTQ